MNIEVIDESSHNIDGAEFAELGAFVLQQMHVHPMAELNIKFVDIPTMTQLHEDWMDLPGPTDVLSFPMDEMRPGREGEELTEGILGDIAICPDVAREQAEEAGHTLVEEMLLLATHGMLHLLGYDHGDEEEEKEMFALQRHLLLTFLAQR